MHINSNNTHRTEKQKKGFCRAKGSKICISDVAANAICMQLAFAIHCRNPTLYPIVLAKCPKTCGLCDQPGALGQCPDTSEICATVRGLPNVCQNPAIAQACMKSCNITTCLPGKFFPEKF
ncbi:unnamed protein product [Dracunculus medinensis]|uniref:ShKT domain-containing protein n=1 Tax=Dracunculus medinensis TaxID=318479 RepID=A0A0N4URA3_DRAME|nr:unnamed protein product [Dracunculus medinensis]